MGRLWKEPGPDMAEGAHLHDSGSRAAVRTLPEDRRPCAGPPPSGQECSAAGSSADAALVERNKELSALVALAETIGRSLELQTVLDDALDKVIEIVTMDCGEIFILDPETEQLVLRASRGSSIPSSGSWSFGLGEGVPGLVAEAGKPLVINNILDDPRFARAEQGWPAPYALVGIPLLARGQVVGVMDLFCLRPCPHMRQKEEACAKCVHLSNEEISLLLAMGQQIGMAIENARLWEELKRKEKNRAHLLKQVITAQEEERKRIARELHDSTGQALTSLMIGLKRLQMAETHEEAGRVASELRDTAARTLDEIHTLALELRPSMLDDMGLAVTLQRYCTEYERRTSIAVDYHRDGLDGLRLPGAMEIAMYRIVQEALTNIAKHSRAGNVSVLLRAQKGRLRAIVEDDGVGFDVAATLADGSDEQKLGLVGMQERAGLLGGTCTIESRPGAGCTVFVEVPIPLEEGESYAREDTAAAGG